MATEIGFEISFKHAITMHKYVCTCACVCHKIDIFLSFVLFFPLSLTHSLHPFFCVHCCCCCCCCCFYCCHQLQLPHHHRHITVTVDVVIFCTLSINLLVINIDRAKKKMGRKLKEFNDSKKGGEKKEWNITVAHVPWQIELKTSQC